MRQLLDTNVLSALMRRQVDEAFGRWHERQPLEDQAISVVSLAEIRFGMDRLSPGKRLRDLEDALAHVLPWRFAGRILPLEDIAADIFGRLLAHDRRCGLNVGDRDLMLAATAHAHDLAVVTRNVSHFEPLGVKILNPWAERRDKD